MRNCWLATIVAFAMFGAFAAVAGDPEYACRVLRVYDSRPMAS
jgi:hypothetical protein